ncbi:MAG: Nucleolar Complex 2 protein [Alyxoria varia]|nr:MAG: Nucleolar Complex 2 protein [Alyxoria varia]
MGTLKQTKRFEKNHLKDSIKRRKDFAKIKQRHQLKAKQKAKRAADNGTEDSAEEQKKDGANTQGNDLETMTVDEFFTGGFDAIDKAAKPGKRPGKRKRKDEVDEDAAEGSSVASVEEHAAADSAWSQDELEAHDNGEDEEQQHKQQLRALAENDPELLGFAEDDNLADMDELANAEGDENKSGKEKAKTNKRGKQDVTHEMVQQWEKSMREKHSLTVMREVVLAFRAAARVNEEDEKDYKYTISNAGVYHELLLVALNLIPKVLNHHIPVKETASGKSYVPTVSKKFSKMTSLFKSHTLSMQHLLENLSDPATMKTALSSFLDWLPYLLTFHKLLRNLSRSIAEIWSDPAQTEATRIQAFLVLRRMTILGDAGTKENVLRTAYQALLKGSRNTTPHTISGINLMKNSAAELWGIAQETHSTSPVAYTTAFQFIRSLAIHLRNSIKHNANESYKSVYNWQYVHALDFFSRVLSSHCSSLAEATRGRESPLRPLIYPLVQVTLGAVRLIPTAAYFPLRFQLTRSLLRISGQTTTFIPLAAPLYEVLTSAEMRKPPRPSTVKPLEFDTSIRAAQSLLRTRVYQDGVGEQVVELLSEFFVLWCRNIAFPELALPVIVMLKRWLKEVSPYVPPQLRGGGGGANRGGRGGRGGGRGGKKGAPPPSAAGLGGNRNNKVNSAVSLLISKLEANSRYVEQRRAKVEFAPKQREQVEGFLKETGWESTPLGAFVTGQRKAREERRRVVEEGRRREEREREKERERGGRGGRGGGGSGRNGGVNGGDNSDVDDVEISGEDDEVEMEDEDDDMLDGEEEEGLEDEA